MQFFPISLELLGAINPPQSQKRERSPPQKGRQPKHHIIPNSKSTSTPGLFTPRASPNLPARKPPAYQKRHTHQKKPRHHQPSTNPPSTARRLTPDTSHVIAQPGPREWNVGATHTTTPHHTAPHHRPTRPHQPTSFQKHPDRLLVDNQTYTPHGAISLSMHACPCEKDSQPTTLRAAGFLFRTTPWLRRRHTCLAGGWMMGMEVGEPRWGSVIIFREPRDRI